MKQYKLHVTRPEFLFSLMTDGSGDIDSLNTQNMKKILCDTTPLCYSVYTVLMEANIEQSDIAAIHNDGESIALTFFNKSNPKKVKDLCNKERVRYGSKVYKVKLKARDKYLVAEVSEVEDEGDSECD